VGFTCGLDTDGAILNILYVTTLKIHVHQIGLLYTY